MAARKVSRRVIGGTAITVAAGTGIVLWPGTEAQTAFGENVAAPLAQATAVSPQPTSTSPQPTPTSRPLRFYPVAPVFVNYYSLVDGPRTLGQAISPLLTSQRRPGPVLREGSPGGPAVHQHHRQPGLRLRVRAPGGRDEGHQQPPPRRGRALQRHLRHHQPAVGREPARPRAPRVPERERRHQRGRLHLYPLHLRPLRRPGPQRAPLLLAVCERPHPLPRGLAARHRAAHHPPPERHRGQGALPGRLGAGAVHQRPHPAAGLPAHHPHL